MWTYTHEARTPLSPAQLWKVITDVPNWPKWDEDIEFTELKEPLKLGSRFTLKPKGGPLTTISVAALQAPRLFTDVSHLPMAKMTMVHEFVAQEEDTLVRTILTLEGPLSFVWRKIIGEKQAAGMAKQTERFFAFAAQQ